jgi:carbon monoxide dehydrogenase subunit G
VLLDIAKSVTLSAPADAVWAFVRQPAQVAGCLLNLQDFVPAGEPNRYTTTLVERLGPFQVRIALKIDVTEDTDARRMVAAVSGDDRGGQARVRGEVRATVLAVGDGSRLDVESAVEVLGRMASLGAVPMRRRGDQIFDAFVKTIGARLEAAHG